MPIDENAPVQLLKVKKGHKYDVGFFSQWTDIPPKKRRALNKACEKKFGAQMKKEERIQEMIGAMSDIGVADPTVYG